jgi:hypothetical protein
MRAIFKNSQGDFCVKADVSRPIPAGHCLVDFVRREGGKWVVWQHGTTIADDLTPTEFSMP